MKKRLLYLATTLLLAGCAQDFDLAEPPVTEPQQETSGTLTRSVDGAVYNEVTDAWMIPLADPFALENVQAAYDRIAEGHSAQALTRAEADGFTPGEKLEPTHYALKIYPKSEEEQWRVETMEDVKVAYIPFSYSQLTHEEVARVEQSGKTRSAANTFTEKSPYTVTYDYTDATDGGPTGPVTYQLPILYAVWPADKPFPDDLEYVVDYPIFLPDLSKLTSDAETRADVDDTTKRVLFGEAIAISRNETQTHDRNTMTRAIRVESSCSILGLVAAYDGTSGVERSVALANLKIRTQSGSLIFDMVSDDGGVLNSYGSLWIWDYVVYDYGSITFTFTYQDPKGNWKITLGNSTVPYTSSLTRTVPLRIIHPASPGNLFPQNLFPPDVCFIGDIAPADEDNLQINEIHRAVNYFYNVQNIFPKHYPSGGTRIIARNVSGRSNYTPANKVINIYGYGRTERDVIGSTLHELGHLFHDLSDPAPFFDTNIFLYESFACYSAWYLTQTYYESLGWVLPYSSYDITTRNARQEWEKVYAIGSASGEYSPLFVDLTDNYNQRRSSYFQHRPNDNIQGVPPSVVWNIISTSKTWTQCRAKLLSYAGAGTGKYYTTAQFNEWIEAFDAWVSLYY